jgi:hypothetical protein
MQKNLDQDRGMSNLTRTDAARAPRATNPPLNSLLQRLLVAATTRG